MAKVYLETSFFSVCVSVRADVKSLGWKASSIEWWETRRFVHTLFISGEVIKELSAPEFPNSSQALAMLRGLQLLDPSQEIEVFADILVRENVMPRPANSGDAIHVATAAIRQMDYILSWNVRHLANENKRTHLAIICMKAGLAPPMIVTPDML